MADILPPSPRPDYSDARRETALSWIRGEGLLDADVTEGARIVAAVGLLICDSSGFLRKGDLEVAMRDPSILQAARTLLEEAAV